METNYKAWFDGACYPNPGGYASYGSVITKEGAILWQGSGLVIPDTGTSNNLAEYAGYIAVLMALREQKLRDQPVTIHGDSELVIKQMRGERRIKNGLYVPLALKAERLTRNFPSIRLEWIPREKNTVADSLASQALFQKGSICVSCLNEEEYDFCFCLCHKNL